MKEGLYLPIKSHGYFNRRMKYSLLITLFFSTALWARWDVTTYNIRNFDRDPREGRTDIAELKRVLLENRSDVMAFQEIVNVSAFRNLMAASLPSYSYQISSCGGNGKQKLALAFNTEKFEFIKRTEDRTFSGGEGPNACGPLRPVLLIDLRHKETNSIYTFGVVHLKAGSEKKDLERRWKQYGGLKHLSARYTEKNLILLGDFNSTGYILKDDDYSRFENILAQSGMRTVSENLGCSNYWKKNTDDAFYRPSLLDHILVQDKHMAKIKSIDLGSYCAETSCRPVPREELGIIFDSVSDHCPIKVTFE